MSELVDCAVEWLSSERCGISRDQMISEITQLAKFDVWPSANIDQWNRAIDQAIEQKLITETSGLLRLAPTPAAEESQEASKQLELF